MKFALLVNSTPYQHQAADTAYQFAKAALAEGHTILCIFFNQDGVYNASRLSVPPQDDRHIVKRWSMMAAEHQVELLLCSASALRRGILDQDEARRNAIDADNLAPGFRIAGLAQLVDAGIEADRLVSFAD